MKSIYTFIIVLVLLYTFSTFSFAQHKNKPARIEQNEFQVFHDPADSTLKLLKALKTKRELKKQLVDYFRDTGELVEMWNGTLWNSLRRYIYTYNPDGSYDEDILQVLDGSNWKDSAKTHYTYTPEGYYSGVEYQHSNGTMWLNDYKYSYTYDSDGYYLEYLFQYGDSLDWMNISRTVYDRNSDHSINTETDQDWNGNQKSESH